LPQIQAFKVAAFERGEACAFCDVDLPTSLEAHVDHTGELEFRHLVSKFTDGGDVRQADPELFAQFHREHAKLQLFCPTCNLTKKR